MVLGWAEVGWGGSSGGTKAVLVEAKELAKETNLRKMMRVDVAARDAPATAASALSCLLRLPTRVHYPHLTY